MRDGVSTDGEHRFSDRELRDKEEGDSLEQRLYERGEDSRQHLPPPVIGVGRDPMEHPAEDDEADDEADETERFVGLVALYQVVELLNQYLRHEILNKVQIIEMNADIALRRTDESVAEYGRLETIAQRTSDIGRFVQSIRSILQASDHQPSLESVQLSGVLSTEIEKLERSFPDVTVTHSTPEDVHVEADDLLSTAISNLLENAVEHGAKRVDVGVAVDDDRVTLRVSDDGPGIPQEAQPTLFDPPESGDHGYGLFLTKNLVELYGGRLELAETGPDGTTFILALSRISPDEETWATTSVKAT